MKKMIGMGMLAIVLIATVPAFATGKGEKAKKSTCAKAKMCAHKPCDKTCDPAMCIEICPVCHKH